MKISNLLLAIFLFIAHLGYSQKYFTRAGKISFYSDTPIEKIEAHNTKATSVFDRETGRMEFAVLIKAFQFEKALMQEHFNENYMESSKFPKASFKGQIDSFPVLDLSKDGEYQVQVNGEMTIHGIAQPLTTRGLISIQGDKITASASFDIRVADYEIEIPALVRENIAKVVKVEVDILYQPLPK